MPHVLSDRILVEIPDQSKKEETKTKSGIILLENNNKNGRDKQLIVPVVDVGDEVKYLKAGDEVIIGAYEGISLEVNGKKYRVLREEDTVAVLREEEPKN